MHSGRVILLISILLLGIGSFSRDAKAKALSLQISTSKDSLVLGVEKSLDVKIKLPEKIKHFNLQALHGSLKIVKIGKKQQAVRAKYTPPAQFFPAVEVLVVSATDGKQVYWGATSVKLIGQGEAKLETSPNATTHVRIGEKNFGPVTADENGQAHVNVQVPPGVTFGLDDKDNKVDLQLPVLPSVALFFAQGKQINLDDTQIEEILLVTFSPRGEIGGNIDSPTVTADFGVVENQTEIETGVFRLRYKVHFAPIVVTFNVYDDKHVDVYTQKVELVASEAFTKTAVELAALKESPSPVDTPDKKQTTKDAPPPLPLTPGTSRWLLGLKGGFGWDFADWKGPIGKLDFSVRLGSSQILGIGLQVGITGSSYSQQMEQFNAQVKFKSVVVPSTLYFWLRIPFAPTWYISPAIGVGLAYVNSTMEYPTLSANNGQVKEANIIFIGEASASIEKEFGPGMILFQIAQGFYNANLATMDGKLFTTELLLGYRLSFDMLVAKAN